MRSAQMGRWVVLVVWCLVAAVACQPQGDGDSGGGGDEEIDLGGDDRDMAPDASEEEEAPELSEEEDMAAPEVEDAPDEPDLIEEPDLVEESPDAPDASDLDPTLEDSDRACEDGLDNDEDGYIDCEDYDCSRDPAVTVCGEPPELEDTDDECEDGLDNDEDGYIDCADFDCTRDPDISVCRSAPEDTDAACDDGLDNDRDGRVDCEDVDCVRDPAVTACRGEDMGNENTPERCRDGLDNDDDGTRDCDEPACAAHLDSPECGDDPFVALEGLRDDALRAALLEEIDEHNAYSYTLARDVMYGIRDSIDIFDGMVECVYTGVQVRPDRTRTPGGIFQTEHSWPRSEGTEAEPAVSDIHHLFPALTEANQARSNHDYGETDCAGEACSYERGGSRLGRNDRNYLVMDVRPERRGDVARAHFYVAVRYGLSIPDFEEDILRVWSLADPPDRRERTRNRRIEVHQRNLNPFVLHPSFVDQIDDF
jgi:endonuclease I